MTTSSTAPREADAPRPLATAILHARIPAPLQFLLLALLAALAMAPAPRRALRLLRQDWFFSANPDTADHPDSVLDSFALRRIRRLRARLGWLLRCAPHEGLALSGHRAPELRPTRLARAPPKPLHAPIHPESVARPRFRRRRLMSGTREPPGRGPLRVVGVSSPLIPSVPSCLPGLPPHPPPKSA